VSPTSKADHRTAAPDPDGGTGEVHALLIAAVDEAARLLDADGALVYLIDTRTGHLRFAHDAGIVNAASRRRIRSIDLPVGVGMFGRAVAERTVVMTSDYLEDPSFPHAPDTDRVAQDIGMRSMVVAPLVSGEAVFGALGTYSPRPNAFSAPDVALVRALADHAAAAMANARLIEDLDASRRELAERADVERSLREIAARISAATDLPAVLQLGVDEAARLLRADGARIDLIDAATGFLRWAYASGGSRPDEDEWPDDPDESMDQGVSGQAVLAGRPYWTGDYATDIRFPHAPGIASYLAQTGIRSVMAAPLLTDTGTIGTLSVFTGRPDAWSESDSQILAAIADQAAITIRTTRLIEETDRAREAQVRRAEAEQALREIAARITAMREPDEILRDVVRLGGRIVPADGVILDLLDPTTGNLHWAMDDGLSAEFDAEERAGLWISIGVGATGIALAEDRVIIGDDDLARLFPPSPESTAFYERTGFRSMIAAPITGDAGALGVLEVYSRRRAAFDAADAGLIGALASQAAIAITNAHLIDALASSRTVIERRAAAEKTLREIAARITAIRRPGDLLQQIVEEAQRLLRADGAVIDEFDVDDEVLVAVYDAGLTDDQRRSVRSSRLRIGEGLSGRAMAERRVVTAGDYLNGEFMHLESADQAAIASGVGDLIVAPIIGDEGPLGAIEVYRRDRYAFDDIDAAVLGGLADQAAIAITTARLIEELERSRVALAQRADTERALRGISAGIAGLRDPDVILDRVVREARRLLDSDGAHLTRMSEDRTYLVPVVATDGSDPETRAWLLGMRFPLGGGINGLAADLDEPVWTRDYQADPRVPHDGSDDTVAARLALCGMAAAPLRAPGGEVIGTLAVSCATPRDFDSEELDLLQGLADQAAIAITNSTLLARLSASEVRFRTLAASSPDMVFETDAEGHWTFLSDRTSELLGWSLDDMIGQHFSGYIGPGSEELAARRYADLVAAPTEVLTVRLDFLASDGRSVPLDINVIGSMHDGRLAAIHGVARDISERDRLERDLLRQAGELAAGEERAHLARELHDSVTQALFSMTLVSRSIGLLLDRDLEAARTLLAQLGGLQREALAEMRALIFELRPGNLEQDGLPRALRTHSASLQGRIGLPVTVESTLEERLPLPIEEALYRIAQEALHNVVKHARARQARVQLGPMARDVRLRVIDDGTGFDPDQVAPGHLGLTGMRARAEKIGGRFSVRGSGRAGSTVEVIVPRVAIDAIGVLPSSPARASIRDE
jgi:PAS domain S-box-containing protein